MVLFEHVLSRDSRLGFSRVPPTHQYQEIGMDLSKKVDQYQGAAH